MAKSYLYARSSGSFLPDLDPVLRLDILPAGAAGAFQVFFAELLWPGLYVAEVTHIVEKLGSFEGKNYQNERHRATLSVEKK